jgi:hypothetical protein
MSASNQRAEWVGHIEDHHADGVTALAAQRARELVGAVSELLRGALDLLFGRGRDIAGQGRVIQHDRHGRRRESAFLRHITYGDHRYGYPAADIAGGNLRLFCLFRLPQLA